MTETQYVLGFAFNRPNGPEAQVALINKRRPAWQANRYNGIGGKVEPTDTSVQHSMAREFQEETGVITEPSAWRHFARHVRSGKPAEGYTLDVLAITLDDEQFDQLRSTTDESVVRWPMSQLASLVTLEVPGTVMYVLMALNHHHRRFFTTTLETA